MFTSWRAGAVAVLAAASLLIPESTAQYPGQYPPGQYPPGQYPPGQYPGQYPGGNRMPGGIPMPRLPGRKSKEKKGEEKITVASVDGTLRKLAEKELLLETRSSVLRFRLIGKTNFVNKAGETVRDSLLHPGDQLTVQVGPDDPETALRVMLVRSGTAAERTTASSELDPSAVRTPKASDLGKPKTISVKEGAGGRSEDRESEDRDDRREPARTESRSESREESRPERDSRAPRETPAPRDAPREEKPVPPRAVLAEPAPAPSGLRDPLKESDEQVIREARAAVASFTANLPDFAVKQNATRYFKAGAAEWQKLDQVTAELVWADGKPEYSAVEMDGSPINKTMEQLGAASVRDFQAALENVLSPRLNLQFKRQKEATIASRPALVYEFQVAQADSQWFLVAADQRRYNPPFSGTIAIDQETRKVLRIEQKTGEIPQDFSIARMEVRFDFTMIRMDRKNSLVPGFAETLSCLNGSGACTRKVSEFRNYRKSGPGGN